jgi:Zn-dependent membrane protease YugP
MKTTLFYVVGGIVFLFSLGVRQKMHSTYNTWSRVRSASGRAGGQVARIILDENHLRRSRPCR